MTNATKTCPKCGEAKARTEFGRNVARSDGLSYACKICTRAANAQWRAATGQAERNRTRLAEMRATDPRRCLNYRYRSVWGISLDRFEEILATQGGGCAICGRTSNPDGGRLAVDHDHDCCPGKRSCGRCVRGILCGPCNKAIGLLRDDQSLLRAAAEYLST